MLTSYSNILPLIDSSSRGLHDARPETAASVDFDVMLSCVGVVGGQNQTFISVEELTDEDKEFLSGRFSGQILLDLGPGNLLNGYKFAQAMGASVYVASEPWYADELLKSFENMTATAPNELRIPYVVLSDDMYTVLSEIADGSLSVMASRIDEYVISKQGYADKVAEETLRVLHPRGAFYSRLSIISPKTTNAKTVELAFSHAHSPRASTGIYWTA